MAVEQAFRGEITLAFDYKQSEASAPHRESIESERISYLIIERMYENINILPVIYISVSLSSEMYTKVVNSAQTSQFYLKVGKRNSLSGSSVYTEVINDTFNYITSTTSPNFSQDLDTKKDKNSSYKNITIGLVSANMMNVLHKSFNGIYNMITQEELVQLALEGMGNIVMQPLKYNNAYKSVIIPPLNTRYKLLEWIFDKDPFYDSIFTFFMDFKNTYLISKNGIAVPGNDAKPTSVMVSVKDYNTREAFSDGFTVQNGAYMVYVNSTNTNVVVNNATEKVSNNLISYSDKNETQNLNMNINNAISGSTKTTYVRSKNAAAIKNELQSNSVMIELMKQNLDSEIFTPNKVYNVSNYRDYKKYDGTYYLSYKREFYNMAESGAFTVSCNIGLKMVGKEEVAKSLTDTYRTKDSLRSSAKRKSSSDRKNGLNSSQASR